MRRGQARSSFTNKAVKPKGADKANKERGAILRCRIHVRACIPLGAVQLITKAEDLHNVQSEADSLLLELCC